MHIAHVNDDSRPYTDVVGGKTNTIERQGEKERGKNISIYRDVYVYI